VLGEVADELALSSTRVHPGRLLATGYQFLYPNLEQALRHVLGK
jgi:NAD dependent epimerase/dehydratase family enzyme